LVAALSVAAVLSVTGALLVARQRTVLVEQLDEALDANVDLLVAAAAADPGAEILPAVGDDDSVAVILGAGGAVVASTPGADDVRFPPGDPGDASTVADLVPGEGRYRVLRRGAELAGEPVTVVVASPLDDIDESVSALTRSLAVAVPLVTVLLAALVYVLVGRTLRPVERIRSEVAAIDGAGLDRRVPQPRGADEIARLATTMNGMLDRLEDADRRQRRFVADASHELRTPLTRIRSEIEVELRHPADERATLTSVLEEIDRLHALIEDQLLLAGGGARSVPFTTVDLDDVVLDEVAAAGRSGVLFNATGVTETRVEGRAPELRRLVRNLLDNAVRHARSRVEVALASDGDAVVLTVTDDGPGVPADQAPTVFDPFTTLEPARRADGTGLGLAIARDIVVRHGGSIAVDSAHRPGARFVVRLPVHPARRGPRP
jgi:signal transduction histidine kinase